MSNSKPPTESGQLMSTGLEVSKQQTVTLTLTLGDLPENASQCSLNGRTFSVSGQMAFTCKNCDTPQVDTLPGDATSNHGSASGLGVQASTKTNEADDYMYKIGMCWQLVEINLRPFFHALDDINNKRSLLENAMFPELLRTFVNSTMDFDEDDYKAFKPLEFIKQERLRLKKMLTFMNTMFYDVLQVYLEGGTFEKSAKDLLFFLHKNDRRGSVELAKRGQKDTEVFLEEKASFGGYEKMLYEAVIDWRKLFFNKTLGQSLIFLEDCDEDSKKAGDGPSNTILRHNFKESTFFIGRAEYFRKLSNLNCMQEKTPWMLTMAWGYEELKNAPNSHFLNSTIHAFSQSGGQLEKIESVSFRTLFSTDCKGKFLF